MTQLYLSRLLLNPRSRQVQRETADPYQRHRTLMQAFPTDLPADERILHRLDTHPRTEALTLLVQSQTRPDWSWLEGKDYLLPPDPFDAIDNPAVKAIALPLRAGQVLSFRLRANPAVKRGGKRHALYREEEQLQWLVRKAARGGFGLLQAQVQKLGNRHGWIHRSEQRSHRLTLHVVQFEGRLQVRDPERFVQTVADGIGPAKAFGCGLLSLAPG